MCAVPDGNLSYESLTSYETRAKLRRLKDENPTFWTELTQKSGDVIAEGVEEEASLSDGDIDGGDDTAVELDSIVAGITGDTLPVGVAIMADGTISASVADSESVLPEDTEEMQVTIAEQGRGKRRKTANKLYGNSYSAH